MPQGLTGNYKKRDIRAGAGIQLMFDVYLQIVEEKGTLLACAAFKQGHAMHAMAYTRTRYVPLLTGKGKLNYYYSKADFLLKPKNITFTTIISWRVYRRRL